MIIENEDILDILNKETETVIYFTTEEETTDNSDTMLEFLNLYDIPENDVKINEGTYCEINFGRELYEVHASGDGDFRSHKIEIKIIKTSNNAKKRANAIAFNAYKTEKIKARKNQDLSTYKNYIEFIKKYPSNGWEKNIKYR